MQSSDLLTSLRHLLGEAHVLQEGNLDAYLLDWRKRWQGRALAVVRPADTAQVAQVVKLCRAAGVSIVPQGGNTGLVGGGVPDASGRQILLSTRRLQRVRSIDAANLTMTVEAGCVLQSAQAAAESAGLLLPLSLAAEGSKHELLSREESVQVAEAERRVNLRTCASGSYPLSCKHELLSPAESVQVAEAERRVNLRTCLSGSYPMSCKHDLLTEAEKIQVAQAESRH
jgi:hypothetical protein